MQEVTQDKVGKDNSLEWVLHFKGATKALILNKTNTNTIIALYGKQSSGWYDKGLILVPDMTDFKGSRVPCIRVKGPDTPKRNDPISSGPQPSPSDLNDEISF